MKTAIKYLLARYTSYEIRRRKSLPRGSLDAVTLALDHFVFSNDLPVLLQIGAADGVRNDPLRRYIESGRFRCVLVEPIPCLYQRLVRNCAALSHVVCVNAAVLDTDGEVAIYTLRDDENYPVDGPYNNDRRQLSSLSRQSLGDRGFRPREIEEIKVRGVTVPTLLREQNLRTVDLLQVDTEGFDAHIVMMALGAGLVPGMINFEHELIPEEERAPLFQELSRHDYEWIHDCANTLAIHRGLARSSFTVSKALY